MKYLISLLLLVPCLASAQQGIQAVHEVAASGSSYTQTVNLCNTGAVDVANDTSSGTLSGAFAIEIYNLASSTNTINCGPDPMVSTATTSAWYGREILAGIGLYFAIPTYQKIYCLTQNSSGCTKATITQFK